MKNTIFLDSGVISLYQSNHEETIKEIRAKKKNHYNFISSQLNYIELFNHLCREKGKINAQIIMENLRQNNIIKFIPVSDKISILDMETSIKIIEEISKERKQEIENEKEKLYQRKF